MASMWRRAMLYLGLGPDDEYDDYDIDDEPMPERRPAPAQSRYPAAPTASRELEREPEMSSSGSVRTIGAPAVRPQPSGSGGRPGRAPPHRGGAPAAAGVVGQAHVVAPTSFNQAQEVADKLKVNQPVIVNLQNVDRDLSRRIIDFASGLCYGIGGQMERVANQVFLLTPSNVEVSAEERRRLQEHGYHEG